MIEVWIAGWIEKAQKLNLLSRRFAMALVGLAPISAAVMLVLQMGLIYVLSFYGLFLPIARLGVAAEPPTWIFWLADTSLNHLSILAVLGLAAGFLFRGWPIVSTLALILLFPSFLAMKSLIVLWAMERVGGRFRHWLVLRRKDDENQRIRLAVFVFLLVGVVVTVLAMGSALDLVKKVFAIETEFHPISRDFMVALVLGLGMAVEVILNMVFLHFYYRATTVQIRVGSRS